MATPGKIFCEKIKLYVTLHTYTPIDTVSGIGLLEAEVRYSAGLRRR